MKLKTKLSKLRHDGHITDAEYSIIINALNKKSKERVQQPCENCISRAEALRIAKSYYHAEYVVDKIRQLPPVTPNQNTGKWINKGDYAECSNCGANSGVQYDGVEPVPLCTRYCPKCGAKMVEPQESEDEYGR